MTDFATFVNKIIDELTKEGRKHTAETRKYSANRLLMFMADKPTPMDKWDELFVQDYETWLKTQGLSASTTAFYLSQLCAFYARQLPREDCAPVECYTREFNYPAQSRIKSAEDLKTLGIKTFFCSNVCAAYRRDIYEELGGFVKHTIFNEDMIYAAKAVEAGYAIAYAADARVVHSHNYTNGQQFHRNFDLGVSQAEHPEVFAAYPSESEGKRMVKDVTAYLRDHHMSGRLPHFYIQCACKYAGYLLGKNYRRLPGKWVLAFTSNKEYWKQNRKDV